MLALLVQTGGAVRSWFNCLREVAWLNWPAFLLHLQLHLQHQGGWQHEKLEVWIFHVRSLHSDNLIPSVLLHLTIAFNPCLPGYLKLPVKVMQQCGGLTWLAIRCQPRCSLAPHQQDGGRNKMEKYVDWDRHGNHQLLSWAKQSWGKLSVTIDLNGQNQRPFKTPSFPLTHCFSGSTLLI